MHSKYSWKPILLTPLALVLFFGLIYAEDGPAFTGEINAKDINLRADANTSSSVIGTLKKGEQLEVVLEAYDWYKVRLPKEAPAYVKKSLTSCIKSTEDLGQAGLPGPTRCLSAKLLADRVNVRLRPDESAPILGVADKAEVVNVISESGGWYKIEPIQNSFGWVYKRFVDKVPVTGKSAPVAQPSSSQISAPDNPEGLALFIGRVEPYGVVFLRKATHKLVSPDNKVFLLKGNRISLNSLNYKKVKVVGRIISVPGAKTPVIEVKIIEVMN